MSIQNWKVFHLQKITSYFLCTKQLSPTTHFKPHKPHIYVADTPKRTYSLQSIFKFSWHLPLPILHLYYELETNRTSGRGQMSRKGSLTYNVISCHLLYINLSMQIYHQKCSKHFTSLLNNQDGFSNGWTENHLVDSLHRVRNKIYTKIIISSGNI